MTTLATETWTGSNGASWPGQWTTNANTGSAPTIQGNQGQMVTGAGGFTQGPNALLSGMTAAADVDVFVKFTVPSPDTATFNFVSLRADSYVASSADVTNGYTLIVMGGGDAWIRLSNAGSNSDVTSQTSYLSTSVGMVVGVRFQAVGASLRARIWDTAGAEPGTWSFTATDSTRSAAGKVGVSVFNDSAVTHTVLWDDLVVTDVPPEIALRAAGATLGATTAVTAISPAVPAGATTGDLSVLAAGGKPFGITFTDPSTWTKVGETTNGTTASGVDTGSTKAAVWTKQSASVGAIGNMTIGGSPNTIDAVINTYSKDPAKTWDVSQFTTGGDTTDGANFSATGAGGLAVAAGDWVVAVVSVNGDIGTASAIAIGGMSGATLGTTQTRTNHAITTGNDTRLIVADVPVTAGSSSAAPTLTYTNASSQSGSVVWLRLRQSGVTSYAVDGSAASTSTTTGALVALRVLAGAATSTSTTAGAVTRPGPLTGSAASGSSTSGAMTATGVLVGSAATASATTGAMIAAGVLAGAAASTSTTTAAMTAAGVLTGAAQSTSATTAAMATTSTLAGSAASSSTTTGAVGTAFPLAGSAASTSTTTGAITFVDRSLSGSAASTSTTTGAVADTSTLTGAAASASSTAGAVATSQPLTGSAVSTSATTAAMLAVGVLTGTASSVSTTSGAFTATRVLAGSATSTSSTGGALIATLTPTGSAASTSTTTGAIRAIGVLAGSAVSASSTAGDISQLSDTYSDTYFDAYGLSSMNLDGGASSVSSTGGSLALSGAVTASATSTSATGGSVVAQRSLAGSAVSVSTTTGALTGPASFAGSAVSTSTTGGAVVQVGVLTGSATSTSATTGELRATGGLAGSAVSVSTTTGSATIATVYSLAGSAASVSTTTGAVVIVGLYPVVRRPRATITSHQGSATLTAHRAEATLT